MKKPKLSIRKNIVYYSPKPEVLEKYVETICQTLEQKYGKGYLNTEVMQGFSDFLKVIAKVYANHLSRISQKKHVKEV